MHPSLLARAQSPHFPSIFLFSGFFQHVIRMIRILKFLNSAESLKSGEDILKPHLGEGGLDELRICALWQQEFSVVLTEHRPDQREKVARFSNPDFSHKLFLSTFWKAIEQLFKYNRHNRVSKFFILCDMYIICHNLLLALLDREKTKH
jgi:hypothetical protein